MATDLFTYIKDDDSEGADFLCPHCRQGHSIDEIVTSDFNLLNGSYNIECLECKKRFTIRISFQLDIDVSREVNKWMKNTSS